MALKGECKVSSARRLLRIQAKGNFGLLAMKFGTFVIS
jgi:hypothetical protein